MGNLTDGNLLGSDATTNSMIYRGFTSITQNVRLHYVGIDGLHNSANWAFHIDLGMQTAFVQFAYTITNLNPGQIYYVVISDYAETDWSSDPTNPAKHTRIFSTNYEPQSIPNALSGGRLLSHIRTRLCHKAAEPICRAQFNQGFPGGITGFPEPTNIKTFYAVNNAKVILDYKKGTGTGPAFHYDETYATYNPNGSLRFSYSPQDQSSPPRDNDTDVGVSGVILPIGSRPQGSGYLNEDGSTTTYPNEAWILQKGTWRIDITTAVDSGIAPIGGGAHYPITLYAEPHAVTKLNSTGNRSKTVFFSGAVPNASTNTTVYTFLRSCCYWQVYFCLGVDSHDASIPNNGHICSFTITATRMGG